MRFLVILTSIFWTFALTAEDYKLEKNLKVVGDFIERGARVTITVDAEGPKLRDDRNCVMGEFGFCEVFTYVNYPARPVSLTIIKEANKNKKDYKLIDIKYADKAEYTQQHYRLVEVKDPDGEISYNLLVLGKNDRKEETVRLVYPMEEIKADDKPEDGRTILR
jgi:hypothetical protein